MLEPDCATAGGGGDRAFDGLAEDTSLNDLRPSGTEGDTVVEICGNVWCSRPSCGSNAGAGKCRSAGPWACCGTTSGIAKGEGAPACSWPDWCVLLLGGLLGLAGYLEAGELRKE